MHFTKPAWVMHNDSSKNDASAKRQPIFSVHEVLTAKIRIWSTKAYPQPGLRGSGKPPKSLCTLTMHTGPVLVVRGSDDEIVMIWDLDPHGGGKVWGSDEVNVEGWKPLKRLVGHESDVTDVAWSPQDRYLASVGLDSSVMIWDGYTLERLQKLEQHQGFVKGVCWDPVGEYLATQSDDRSVKIWRTTDWEVEATVTKPFEDSPGSTFFRRLSWSPDGAHITASNATNNNGSSSIAAVITRNLWTSEISLSYNPHIFLRNSAKPISSLNICSVVALGADDRSVSVWQTKSARPIIVAKQLTHICRSSDGLTLYAASSDGTIAVFHFTPDELEGIAPPDVHEQYLTKFEFALPPPPAGYAHVGVSQPTPPPSPGPVANIQVPKINIGGEQVNQLVARRGKAKKRATLVPSSAIGGPSQINGSATAPVSRRAPLSQIPDSRSFASSSKASNFGGQGFDSPFEQPFEDRRNWGNRQSGEAMEIDSISAFESKRGLNILDLSSAENAEPSGRTLGGDKSLEPPTAVRQLAKWASGSGPSTRSSQSAVDSARPLPTPPLLSHVKSQVEESDCQISVANDDKSQVVEVCYTGGQKIHWVDYVESPALLCKATKVFSALACQDGSIITYTPVGRRYVVPALSLGSPAAFLDTVKHFLLVITSSGMLHCWDMRQKKASFPPTSLIPLLTGFSNDTFYSYDPDLFSFFKLTERWWAEHSEYWLNLPGVSHQFDNGPLTQIDKQVKVSSASTLDSTKPKWWAPAITLGHVESKMMNALRMESTAEFKAATLAYARRLADEGFRDESGRVGQGVVRPYVLSPSTTICGLDRRELVREVILIFARKATLVDLAAEWHKFVQRADDQVY
ncbi:transcription corepressor [Coprinopsis sp. MPI-PUGE-AT-0042]|nr:transcription corepressor [Coprinopsis sp. MPI-PUGE-AT-0042]